MGPLTIKDEDKQLNSTYSFLDIFGAEAEQLYLESAKKLEEVEEAITGSGLISQGKKIPLPSSQSQLSILRASWEMAWARPSQRI